MAKEPSQSLIELPIEPSPNCPLAVRRGKPAKLTHKTCCMPCFRIDSYSDNIIGNGVYYPSILSIAYARAFSQCRENTISF
jgi:hypothetical protein